MIITVEGKLGSGKTYWCVNYLAEKYYVWNSAINQFVSKFPDLRIITNIDELDLPHENLGDDVRSKGIATVFNQAYVEGSAHCIYIIDEAQYMFDRKFANKEVFRFFQMSRHYGVDILLITQDVDTLSKELRVLCEYTIRALPRSRSARGIMRYSWESEKESFKSQTLKFKKEVGKLYRSRTKEESMPMPNTWKKYLYYAAGAVAVAALVLMVLVNSIWKSSDDSLLAPSERRLAQASGAGGTAKEAMAKYKASLASPVPVSNQPGTAIAAEGSLGKKEKKAATESIADKENGMKRGLETEREPLVPARCYEENDGWRVCFEGDKPIGRYRVENEYREKSRQEVAKVIQDERFRTRRITVPR